MKLFSIPQKYYILPLLMFLTISLLAALYPKAFGSSCYEGEWPVRDTLKKDTPEVKFEKIPVHSLPKFSDVQWVIAKSGLGSYCQKYKIDQMEIDLMFAKTGPHTFNEFRKIKFKNESGKRYMDIFPGKNLYDFWETARQVLRNYNKELVPEPIP